MSSHDCHVMHYDVPYGKSAVPRIALDMSVRKRNERNTKSAKVWSKIFTLYKTFMLIESASLLAFNLIFLFEKGLGHF